MLFPRRGPRFLPPNCLTGAPCAFAVARSGAQPDLSSCREIQQQEDSAAVRRKSLIDRQTARLSAPAQGRHSGNAGAKQRQGQGFREPLWRRQSASLAV